MQDVSGEEAGASIRDDDVNSIGWESEWVVLECPPCITASDIFPVIVK